MCHWAGMWGKWGISYEGACLSTAAMFTSILRPVPLKALHSATFENAISLGNLSAKSFSFSLPLSVLSWHFATCILWRKKRSFSCSAKKTNPQSYSHRPILCLGALPRLPRPHPSFIAIAHSWSCTCPQRPIWKQTPPIFNSSLFIFICHHVRAVAHSVASPLPETFADFPTHTGMQAHTHVHTN